MLTWMRDNRELVQRATFWNDTKCNIVMLKLTLTIGQVRCLQILILRFEGTKVHVILRSYVVLTWMRDCRELVHHATLWNNTKGNIVMLKLKLTINLVRCL